MCIKISMPACDTARTIPQDGGGTCWFNALITALFYSDGMSAYLKKVIPDVRKKTKSVKKKEILDILEELLNAREITDAREFDKFYKALEPMNILRLLHKKDKMFYFDPNKRVGHKAETYLVMLFQFLEIKDKIIFIALHNGKYYFSEVNNYSYKGVYDSKREGHVFEKVGERKKPPSKYLREPSKYDYASWMALDYNDYDMVVISEVPPIGSRYYDTRGEFPLMIENHKLDIFGIPFVVDSLLLMNFNNKICKKGHEIAGVTCKGKRYLYNGWVKLLKPQNISYRPTKSCKLFPFDWMKIKSNFTLDRQGCKIHKTRKVDKNDMTFNVNRKRTYIYMKESLIAPVAKNIPNQERCKDGKVRNPATGRCVKKKTAPKVTPCKDGKVRNPATGRCVKKLPKAAPKVAPEKPPCKDGKVRNPATGRCVKKLPKTVQKVVPKVVSQPVVPKMVSQPVVPNRNAPVPPKNEVPNQAVPKKKTRFPMTKKAIAELKRVFKEVIA